MSISIFITNKKISKSFLYSELNHKGKRKIAPAYQMLVANESGSVEEFLVTRDTIVTAFGKKTKGKYGEDDEAPPHKAIKPYRAHIRADGKKGFRLELYEPGVGNKRNNFKIKGVGRFIRPYIQIHLGPGRSEGCFLLAGRKTGRDKFKRAIQRLIREDKRNRIKNPARFIVRVAKR